MSEGLIAALRKAADWGEDEFDVLSPQDAAAADRIEALERELAELKEVLINTLRSLRGAVPLSRGRRRA